MYPIGLICCAGLWLDCMFGEGQSVESCTTYGDYVQLR